MAALSHCARVIVVLATCWTISLPLPAAEPTQSLDEQQANTLQELQQLAGNSEELARDAKATRQDRKSRSREYEELEKSTVALRKATKERDRGMERAVRDGAGDLIVMATPGKPDDPHYQLAKRSLEYLQQLAADEGINSTIVIHITDTTPVERHDWSMLPPSDTRDSAMIWCTTNGGVVPKEALEAAVEKLTATQHSVPEPAGI